MNDEDLWYDGLLLRWWKVIDFVRKESNLYYFLLSKLSEAGIGKWCYEYVIDEIIGSLYVWTKLHILIFIKASEVSNIIHILK